MSARIGFFEYLRRAEIAETKAVAKASAARREADALTAQLQCLHDFAAATEGTYLLTAQGPGTVLAVLRTESDHRLRVFVGQGETARIVEITHREFQGLLRA